jgi:hypothetical protein
MGKHQPQGIFLDAYRLKKREPKRLESIIS